MAYVWNLIFGLALLNVFTDAVLGSRVLELSDRFLEIRKDGQWLVMFYAPWCAHCKRLEPIWAHVAQSLHNTNIRVGRVDCTRFTSMASEFGVSGFPTIMFLKGERKYVFKADRTKEEIVNFAIRMSGPPVQQITRPESIDNLKASNPLFFVYVGNPHGPLWESFYSVAEKFQPYGFFYAVSEEIARKHVKLKSAPVVFVYKENMFYFFDGDDFKLSRVARGLEDKSSSGENEEELKGDSLLNNTLHEWVNKERFETFLKVTRGNINQVLQTGKYLVLAVLQENKLQDIPSDMIQFRDMVESVIRENRDRYHETFQFGWVGSPDLANSIAMTVLPLPNLLVINSTTNHHHLPSVEASSLSPESLAAFLDEILNHSVPAYGGNTLPTRLYRTYFEARTSLAEMWQGNPVLTAVLFGLPLGFLSLICYSVCCADIMDANEEEEEEEDEGSHEKRE
ncbi:protein disulfide-isomerase TMX3 isoform X1 [Ischnura elegans]|uniref:protein disulfide-isomerase TMX3 isoform X1 n=1 Tax=Ischnura elegans TaxID=197161 RepID=UPI001ED86D06|nr:protein disulfide-isomerase TMX3 isoform X1 [Ischnura elegans]